MWGCTAQAELYASPGSTSGRDHTVSSTPWGAYPVVRHPQMPPEKYPPGLPLGQRSRESIKAFTFPFLNLNAGWIFTSTHYFQMERKKKKPFGCNLLESCLLLENAWERKVCKGYENEVRTKGLCAPLCWENLKELLPLGVCTARDGCAQTQQGSEGGDPLLSPT